MNLVSIIIIIIICVIYHNSVHPEGKVTSKLEVGLNMGAIILENAEWT